MSDTHAETVAFVRDTMLPEKAPPAAHIGVVGWARINLFSGWMNTVLTIISLLFVGFVLYEILPWLISPTWDGASLTNCREILAALGDDRGACWGVIRERWPQLMFGFYPAELYWRPVLTFVLLLVAVSPVLFADYVPSKILWFSMPVSYTHLSCRRRG